MATIMKLDLSSECKRLAAYAAVESNVQSGQTIGVGTGSTAKFVVDALAELYKNEQTYQHSLCAYFISGY